MLNTYADMIKTKKTGKEITSRDNKDNKIVNITAVFCACVLVISSLSAFLPVRGEQRIYDDLIRLHVLANSNSESDQKLKLEVRDYILNDISNLTEDCADIYEAVEKISGGLDVIQIKAVEYIKGRGYDYPVDVTLTKEVYPTREYNNPDGVDFVLPSGEYMSLRVIIGEGEGKNWWCVLFPPLCLSGSKMEDEMAIAGYTEEQIKILKKDKSSKYVIRFKILEILSEIFK